MDIKTIPYILKERQLADGSFLVDDELLKLLRIDAALLKKQAVTFTLTEAEVILILALYYFSVDQKADLKDAYSKAYKLAFKIQKAKKEVQKDFSLDNLRKQIAEALKAK